MQILGSRFAAEPDFLHVKITVDSFASLKTRLLGLSFCGKQSASNSVDDEIRCRRVFAQEISAMSARGTIIPKRPPALHRLRDFAIKNRNKFSLPPNAG